MQRGRSRSCMQRPAQLPCRRLPPLLQTLGGVGGSLTGLGLALLGLLAYRINRHDKKTV
jgi:hypothetical protein